MPLRATEYGWREPSDMINRAIRLHRTRISQAILLIGLNLRKKRDGHKMQTDKVIIGAGLYGLYAALFCARRGEKVAVLECDSEAFGRATYVNQARVHQGYHYPRSLSTAAKSAGYFARFNKDFDFCIHREFKKIYATSSNFSWSSGQQFKDFCKAADIPCEEVPTGRYFQENVCDGAFLTREYTYDARILRDYYLEKLEDFSNNVEIVYGAWIKVVDMLTDTYRIELVSGDVYEAPYVLNATYAGTNQILTMLGYEPFGIKYELCEIILCNTNEKLHEYGITVMDGPFFSIMPFGKTGMHSLTAVSFTPHTTCYESLPQFDCQDKAGNFCSREHLGNCNHCLAKPATAYPYMSALARKYLREEYGFDYKESLFSMKPILMSSEIDDSRPTVIRIHNEKPKFVSVLSGKINTVYDLDEVLI